MTRINVPFPIGGFTENSAYERTPQNTTIEASNVYPYDSVFDKQRGGQRPGTSKYIKDAVNGTNTIQNLDQIAKVLDSRAIVPSELLFEDEFTGADSTVLSNGNYQEYSGNLDNTGGCLPDFI